MMVFGAGASTYAAKCGEPAFSIDPIVGRLIQIKDSSAKTRLNSNVC
jgi:hypothetical protein